MTEPKKKTNNAVYGLIGLADIECTNEAVVVTIDGTRYAANGTARSLPGVQPLDNDSPAWADHPDVDGAKVPLTDVIEHGRSLC